MFHSHRAIFVVEVEVEPTVSDTANARLGFVRFSGHKKAGSPSLVALIAVFEAKTLGSFVIMSAKPTLTDL